MEAELAKFSLDNDLLRVPDYLPGNIAYSLFVTTDGAFAVETIGNIIWHLSYLVTHGHP